MNNHYLLFASSTRESSLSVGGVDVHVQSMYFQQAAFLKPLERNLRTESHDIHIALHHVPKHIPKRISIDSVLHRVEAASDLGFQSEEWTHQSNYRPRHSELGARDHGHQCFDKLYRLSRTIQANTGHQTSISRNDYQESQ